MTAKYQDPYKDDPYGKLKGDKSDHYFKVTFSEAKIIKTDNAYIFAAWVDTYEGVQRSYKPENSILPGLCAIPFYGGEYNIPKKDDNGKWQDNKTQPSIFEKSLYDSLVKDEADYVGDDKVISGSITHLPNGMLESMAEDQRNMMVASNISLLPTTGTGKLKDYTPPKTYGGNKGGGKSWGMSPDKRVEFLKKQLASDVAHQDFTESNTLAELTSRMLVEHSANPNFITIYFDMLIACCR